MLQGEWWKLVGCSHAYPLRLKSGSCGLEYRLVEIPKALRDGYTDEPLTRTRSSFPNRECPASSVTEWLGDGATVDNFLSKILSILWIALLIFIVYKFLQHFFLSREWSGSRRPQTGNRGTGPRPRGPGFGSGSNWFGGRDHPRRHPSPPPPYVKDGPTSSGTQAQGSGPGFWTGVATGGLGSYIYNRTRQPGPQPQPQSTTWDWERPRMARSSGWFGQSEPQPSAFPSNGWGSTARSDDNRGEGSSNLGSMRTSTGFGGSHVR